MSRFISPRPDGRAEWRVIYDMFCDLHPGDTITHAKLMAALDTDDVHRVYKAARRARRELWEYRQRSVAVVAGRGYRMLKATEHERQAYRFHRSARRRMSDAVAVARATNLDELDDAQREWMVKVQNGLVFVANVLDDHHRRITHHDDLIASLQQRIEHLEQR